MKFMGTGGMKAGVKTKESQGTFSFLSQVIDKNNTYRIFYPVIKLHYGVDEEGNLLYRKEPSIEDEFDIQAVTLPGYKTDLEKMGTTFYPLGDGYEINDVGQVIDLGGMPRRSRISRILFDAEYRRACAMVEATLKAEAQAMKTEVDPNTVKEAQDKLEVEYYGAKVNGTQVPPKFQQAIQSLRIFIFTAGVIFKLEAEGSPKADTEIQGFSLELNAKKINQIKAAVAKATGERRAMMKEIERKRNIGEELTEAEANYKSCLDLGYIEVEYAYNGADKKEAGNSASFVYCGATSDATSFKFRDFWSKKKDEILGRLVYEMGTMAAKNRNISMAPTEEKIDINFKTYCAQNAALGSFIDFEGENSKAIKRAAKDFLEIDGFKKNPMFYEKLKEAEAEGLAEEADRTETTEEEDAVGKTVGSILTAAKNHASMSEVLEAAGDADSFDAATSGFEPGSL